MVKKRWIYSPSGKAKPKVSTAVKAAVKIKADNLVEAVLKPTHVKPPPEDTTFNYVADIYTKWHGRYFYFCAKYHSPGPYAISPEFETKFARLEYISNDSYHLSYMRHTDQWWELYQHLSLDECLQAVSDEPHFIP